METYSVEIRNPKAVRLLQDLADMDLIVLKPVKTTLLSDEEREKAREAVLHGSPTMNIEAMLEHLRESRQDRKLPFRDE